MNETWTVTEAPATYFVRQDEVKEQLAKAGIPKNTATVIATGKYDVEIQSGKQRHQQTKHLHSFDHEMQKQHKKQQRQI
ncbi:hypothetical protein ACHAW6_013562 [Cyclotella cf. meneghiniana]